MDTVGTVKLLSQAAYRFEIDFGLPGVPHLKTDTTPPLGQGDGPDCERLPMAAVATCLSASLAFSLCKSGNEGAPNHTSIEATPGRHEQGRLREHAISIDLKLGVPGDIVKFLQRSLAQHEDFRVVTQSVRGAIPVVARGFDNDGAQLLAAR